MFFYGLTKTWRHITDTTAFIFLSTADGVDVFIKATRSTFIIQENNLVVVMGTDQVSAWVEALCLSYSCKDEPYNENCTTGNGVISLQMWRPFSGWFVMHIYQCVPAWALVMNRFGNNHKYRDSESKQKERQLNYTLLGSTKSAHTSLVEQFMTTYNYVLLQVITSICSSCDGSKEQSRVTQ